MVTSEGLYRIKYDFETDTIEKITRTDLSGIQRVLMGPVRYTETTNSVLVSDAMRSGSIFAPDGTALNEQNQAGVRVVESMEEVPWYKRYNPMTVASTRLTWGVMGQCHALVAMLQWSTVTVQDRVGACMQYISDAYRFGV